VEKTELFRSQIFVTPQNKMTEKSFNSATNNDEIYSWFFGLMAIPLLYPKFGPCNDVNDADGNDGNGVSGCRRWHM